MKPCVILFLASLVVSTYAGSITRNKRGYLSRTGMCPNPADNRQIRDVRLNYWGMAVIRQSDNPKPGCSEKECDEDSHCDGNRKCCPNFCGAKVCTVSMRDPDPCSNFHCPSHQTCKVQLVRCVMPDCPAAESINRPTCIPKEQVQISHADKLGDYQPDTTANFVNTQPDAALSYTQQQQQQQQTPYSNMAFNDATTNDQQAYAAPMDPSAMAEPPPAEVPNVVQSPMDSTASYATPSQDTANTLNYQAQPADVPQMADQPPAAEPQMADQPQEAQPQMMDQPPMEAPQEVAQPPAQ